MKPQYFIRQESCQGDEKWHGPFEVIPKRKLKALTEHNDYDDFTVYRCEVVGIDWERL